MRDDVVIIPDINDNFDTTSGGVACELVEECDRSALSVSTYGKSHNIILTYSTPIIVGVRDHLRID